MKITGEVRVGSEFRFEKKISHKADSTFTAILPDSIVVTCRFEELCKLPENTTVLAHWHGNYRTEAFASTVGELNTKALEQGLC